jgi:WD40 repeat protein
MRRVQRVGELDFAEGVSRISWSPDGSWFGVIAYNNFVVMDANTFDYKISASGPIIAFSYDGKLLETGISQYNLETGEKSDGEGGATLYSYPNDLLDAEFSPDGRYIVAGGTSFAVIHPTIVGVEEGVFGRFADFVIHTSVSPDGKTVAVNYGWNPFTELWDPYQRKPNRILKLRDIGGQGKPRFSRDGRSLFFTGIGTWEENEVTYLQEWDYHTGKPISIQMIPGASMEKGASMDISPLSPIAAMGTMDGKIYLVPIHDCRPLLLGEYDSPRDPVYMIGFRPDGKVLATIGWSDTTVDFWGIPAPSNLSEETMSAVESTQTQVECPNIPMEIEQPYPETDWFGGGRPYSE